MYRLELVHQFIPADLPILHIIETLQNAFQPLAHLRWMYLDLALPKQLHRQPEELKSTQSPSAFYSSSKSEGGETYHFGELIILHCGRIILHQVPRFASGFVRKDQGDTHVFAWVLIARYDCADLAAF